MTEKRAIVHILPLEKFTGNYVNFMKLCMSENYTHTFLLGPNEAVRSDFKPVDETNLYYLNSYRQLREDAKILELLQAAEQIIVSGLFGQQYEIFYWPRTLKRKTAFQFWGADFYGLQKGELAKGMKPFLRKVQSICCFAMVKRHLFLLESDSAEFRRITHVSRPYQVVTMPPDPGQQIDFTPYRGWPQHNPLRIQVGNSATATNEHEEILRLLAAVKNQNFEITCPLSYGNMEYGSQIAALGRELFGERFHAVTDFMEPEQYMEYLASCDVAIFGMRRQQALGNIIKLLGMGRKVYLREETPMYADLTEKGYALAPFSELAEGDLSKLAAFDGAEQNMRHADSVDRVKNNIERWTKVFERP